MWENPEEAFKELDEQEYDFFAKPLANYRTQLMKEGFTRREAMRLVESYAKFIYDMIIEQFLKQRQVEEDLALEDELDEFDEDVADDEDDELE